MYEHRKYKILLATFILIVTTFFTVFERQLSLWSGDIFVLLKMRVGIIIVGFVLITFFVLHKNIKEGSIKKRELERKSENTLKELKKMTKK